MSPLIHWVALYFCYLIWLKHFRNIHKLKICSYILSPPPHLDNVLLFKPYFYFLLSWECFFIFFPLVFFIQRFASFSTINCSYLLISILSVLEASCQSYLWLCGYFWVTLYIFFFTFLSYVFSRLGVVGVNPISLCWELLEIHFENKKLFPSR